MRCCLEQKVEKLGLADSVRIVGYKEDVAAWMAYCDVFCLPSFVESFSLSLIEALRAGLPSIVSDAGGIPEAVSRNEALFVRAGDVNSITSCIEIMSDDESLRMRLGNAARRRFLDNFTEKKMMRGVADWLLKCGGCNA